MILLIGNRASHAARHTLHAKSLKRKEGFTLVEVMVAVVVLAVGLIIIYEAFLTSIDTINLFYNRLNAQLFISEKIGQMQDNLDQPQSSFLFSVRSGTIKYANRNFDWQINLKLEDVAQELYQIEALINWKDGQSSRTIKRTTKALRYFGNAGVDNY